MFISDLVESARDTLRGSGLYTDRSVELTEDLTEDFTNDLGQGVPKVIKVDDSTGIGGCIVEIDYERIRVKSADSNVLHVYGFGRGYGGSVPAVHSAGAEVRINPIFPASVVLAKAKEIVSSLYPDVYGVKTVDLAYDTSENEEALGSGLVLPPEASGIISVHLPDRDGKWVRQRVWDWDPAAGNGLTVPNAVKGGTVRVVYSHAPSTDLQPGLDFQEVTGLSEHMASVVTLGIAWSLTANFEVARSPHRAAEHRADAQATPSGAAATASRYLRQLYDLEVEKETRRLNRDFPIKVHRDRKRVIA